PLIQGEQTARREVEGSALGSQLDVAGNRLDRDASLRLMRGKTRTRLQGGQDDSKVLVLDEGLRVLAAAPPGLAMELLQLPREIEFEIRGRHRLRVRASVLCVFIGRV